jgi:flagellar motor switch protein FliN/FliY
MPVLKGGNGGDKPAPGGGARGPAPAANLDHILNMELTAIVVLAERSMRVDDVLNLRPGSIVEFPKSAEDLMDFQINNRTIARGETVKDGEKFGLQIRQINRVQDTVRALGQM